MILFEKVFQTAFIIVWIVIFDRETNLQGSQVMEKLLLPHSKYQNSVNDPIVLFIEDTPSDT